MRAATILLAAAMAATPAVADKLELVTYWFLGSSTQYIFHTDFGSYQIFGAPGCLYNNLPPPGMTELCIDLGQQRAHFKFVHQNFKRCLKLDPNLSHLEPGDVGSSWFYEYYVEVPCTWKMAAGDDDAPVEAVSVVAETGATAATKTPVPYQA